MMIFVLFCLMNLRSQEVSIRWWEWAASEA